MKKIWYIKIDEKIEGPFSVRELKRDPRITPDTLVWRSGFDTWIALGRVVELKSIFAEDEGELQRQEPPQPILSSTQRDEVALNLPVLPPMLLFWLILALLVTLYFIYRFNVI